MSSQNHNYQTDYYEYKLTALIDNEPYFANLVDQIGSREANLHKLSLPIDLVLIIIIHLEHVAIIGVGLVT
jgi:hypothetical protein